MREKQHGSLPPAVAPGLGRALVSAEKPGSVRIAAKERRRLVGLNRTIRFRRYALPELFLCAITLLIFVAILYYLIQQRVAGG